jgi:hypothetical protein
MSARGALISRHQSLYTATAPAPQTLGAAKKCTHVVISRAMWMKTRFLRTRALPQVVKLSIGRARPLEFTTTPRIDPQAF